MPRLRHAILLLIDCSPVGDWVRSSYCCEAVIPSPWGALPAMNVFKYSFLKAEGSCPPSLTAQRHDQNS